MFKNKEEFKRDFSRRLIESYGCTVDQTHPTEKFTVLGNMVRDYACVNWKDTKQAAAKHHSRQVYYFSMEFLLGRMMTSNLQNLGIYDMVKDGLKDLGISYEELAGLEEDPGLGNGGLGRLAACLMDSAASMNYPVNGNCIRYRCGLFRQKIAEDGSQQEVPDLWLSNDNVWEIRKLKHAADVAFYGNVEVSSDHSGDLHFRHVNAEHITAVPYDMELIGAHTKMTNTLRLWSAEPAEESPANMDVRQYLADIANICMNVYPDDSTEEGRFLRLKQQYFFVCAGINSIIKAHLNAYHTLDNLPDKVAIQLNDTHPVLAIPEMMRVLMDEYGYPWEQAFQMTQKIMSYTNHTVMSEALEKWPVYYIQKLLPRIYMIITELDSRFVQYAQKQFTNSPDKVDSVRIIRDNEIRMANLAIVGSHSVNGVAQMHTEILEKDLFRDFYELFSERFSNKTNGITQRRWLLYSNPQLRKLLDKTIGTGYETKISDLQKLMKHVDDPRVQKAFLKVKQERKEILAEEIYQKTGIKVDPDSIFDTQAKRLHAYKRQLLNILHVIALYQKIKEDPSFEIYPHTYIFAGKAAPQYTFAKRVIQLINCAARVINSDPEVRDLIKVVFLPNYNVTMAESLMNASDVSEQISTAGKEASGTGNMKFMMNGAITLGTLDGANVEIDQRVGRDNDVIFGMSEEEIETMRSSYRAQDLYETDDRIRRVMDTLIDGTWNGNENDFRLIYDEMLGRNDEYFVLADFNSYWQAQQRIERKYRDRSGWARSCLINIAQSWYFSSDRTLQQYADEIWQIKPVKI